MSSNNKQPPGYLLPTINSAARSSITDEEKRIDRANHGKQWAKSSRETARTSLDHKVEKKKTYTHDTSKRVVNDRIHQEKTDQSTKITSKPPIGPAKTDGKSSRSMTRASDKTSVFKISLTSGGSDLTSSDTKNYNETNTASYEDNTKSSHDTPVDKSTYTGVTDTTEGLDRDKSSFQSISMSGSRFRRSTSNELDYSSLQKKEGDDYYSLYDRSPDSLQYETMKSTPARISYQNASASAAKFSEMRDNLDFYTGRIRSKPAPGYSINEMLKWKGDYGILERNHLYIQWLFPIPEGRGLNSQAQPLTEYEAEAIREDATTKGRVLEAYKMMLDFYGMRLKSVEHGTVARCQTNYKERYEHLNRSRHNLLRITRIIKSLGELGFAKFQAPLVFFLHEEAYITKALPKLKGSCFHHWINAINNIDYRNNVNKLFYDFQMTTDKPVLYAKSGNEDKEEFNRAGSIDDEDDVTETTKNKNDQQRDVPEEVQKHVSSDSYEIENIEQQPEAASNTNGHEFDLGQLNVRRVFSDEDVLGIGYNQKNQSGFVEKNEENGAVAKDTDLLHKKSHLYMNGPDMDAEMPNDNLKFYRNDLHSRPSPGYTIETILKHTGDYKFLNEYPYFSQWLFPTPEGSEINQYAQPLNSHEAEAIINNEETFERVLKAYVLILDYYGMKIVDKVTGELRKSDQWKSRWDQLNKIRYCEFKRITRVLKFLGELGYERYQVPLIKMFIDDGELNDTDVKGLTWNHVSHWICSIKDIGEREAMFYEYKLHLFSLQKTYAADKYDDTSVLSCLCKDINSSAWDNGIQFM